MGNRSGKAIGGGNKRLMLGVSIVIILSLAGIAWYDFKDRTFPVILLFVAFAAKLLCFFVLNKGFGSISVIFNLLMLILNIGLLILWFRIRHPQLKFFKEIFGWGDLLLLVLAALFFNPIAFQAFILGSAIVGLVIGIYIKHKKGNLNAGIPLAGVMAGILIIIQISALFGNSFY